MAARKSTSLALPIAGIFMAFAVAGCATIAPLPDGRLSAMDPADARTRGRFDLSPAPLPAQLIYGAAPSCLYRQTLTSPDGKVAEKRFSVSVKRVRDRYLVTMNSEGKVSTALIGASGKLFDFNLAQDDGSQVDSGTYGQFAREKAVEAGRPEGGVHVINDFTLMFPEYLAGRRYVGEPVASVLDETGGVWGSYVYQGIMRQTGPTLAVFDMTRILDSRPDAGAIVMGFSIVDMTTMLPVLYVLDAGYKLRVERISCS